MGGHSSAHLDDPADAAFTFATALRQYVWLRGAERTDHTCREVAGTAIDCVNSLVRASSGKVKRDPRIESERSEASCWARCVTDVA